MYQYCPNLAAAVNTDETKSISFSSFKRSYGHVSENFTRPQHCYLRAYFGNAMTSRPYGNLEPHQRNLKQAFDHRSTCAVFGIQLQEGGTKKRLLYEQMAFQSGLSHTAVRFILLESYKYDGQ